MPVYKYKQLKYHFEKLLKRQNGHGHILIPSSVMFFGIPLWINGKPLHTHCTHSPQSIHFDHKPDDTNRNIYGMYP